eukprot:8374435-Alexandrium_andersonii.AAC.2
MPTRATKRPCNACERWSNGYKCLRTSASKKPSAACVTCIARERPGSESESVRTSTNVACKSASAMAGALNLVQNTNSIMRASIREVPSHECHNLRTSASGVPCTERESLRTSANLMPCVACEGVSTVAGARNWVCNNSCIARASNCGMPSK